MLASLELCRLMEEYDLEIIGWRHVVLLWVRGVGEQSTAAEFCARHVRHDRTFVPSKRQLFEVLPID